MAMTKEELVEDLKVQIISQLNLEDLKPEDINPSDPLFNEGLGLDSIDALELIVLMEKRYGIRIENPDAGKSILSSIQSMADYIHQQNKS